MVLLPHISTRLQEILVPGHGARYPVKDPRRAWWGDVLKKTLKTLSEMKPIEYEEAKRLARHEDPEVRRKLAEREDVKPEILYYLAEDDDPDVRRLIASNSSAPRMADVMLATDADDSVRVGLASKISLLAPGLTSDEQDKVRRMAYDALEVLARDQVTKVRQVISETLKDVADAPPEVISRLARDAELVVCGPVLEYSPVLTDDELLDIIASDPVHGALSYISRRSAVVESVADALVSADDSAAIANLLANPSAQIREETLDRIIDRAPDEEDWHEPLARRPRLPARAAQRLARFVAKNLLELMTAREDLDPETVAAVREEVARRLAEDAPAEEAEEEEAEEEEAEPEVTALDIAREMHAGGTLTEDAVNEAMGENKREFVLAALSVLSNFPVGAVQKTMNTKSAKGVVALSWKAGLSPKIALEIQRRVAAIPHTQLVRPKDDGSFALTEDSMEWQLEFLRDLG